MINPVKSFLTHGPLCEVYVKIMCELVACEILYVLPFIED